jgi:glycosyltransferase involved in cell wall biosynthesis
VYAHELHRALRHRDAWEPTFLARSGPPQSAAGAPHETTPLSPVEGADDEYLLFPEGHDFDWLYGTMRLRKSLYTRALRRFLLDLRPDVVHFQHSLFIGYDALREVRRTLPEAAIVYTLHEYLPICHNKGQMVRTMDRALCGEASPRRCNECFPEIPPAEFFLRRRFIQAQLGLVDLFVAPSETLLERFVEWGLPRERILLEDYGRLRQAASGRDGPRAAPHATFGIFGQLTPYKGIDVALRAMRALEGHPARLRVHGANLDLQEHGFRDEIAGLLESAGENVRSIGPYRAERVGVLMSEVDWVLVPSTWWENSPLVIQEAFSRRRPVVCSDVGGMAEKVRDGVDGLHFRVGDADSLAETMRRAVDTPGLWQSLRERAPETPSMAQHVEVLTEAYEDLIERRPAGARA